MWDVRKFQLLKTLTGHRGVIFAVEMDDSTEMLYSGARDNVSLLFSCFCFCFVITNNVSDDQGVGDSLRHVCQNNQAGRPSYGSTLGQGEH